MSERPDALASAPAAFEEILANYPVVESFRPLNESRLWTLNQGYWQRRGPRAFTRDAVPFHVTNDSTLSVATAELMISWVRAQADRGSTPSSIVLLELGPGSGLFARLTARFYARRRADDPALPPLRYLGIDGAASMVEAIRERRLLEIDGVSADFAVLDLNADVDRLGPLIDRLVPKDAPLFAVANYLLDSLPSTLLRMTSGSILETVVELRARDANSEQLDDRHLIVRQKGRARDPNDPLVQLAAPFLREDGAQIAFNTGAMRVLQVLSTALRERGCILVNDYATGVSEVDAAPCEYFAGSIANGLHFPSMEAFVTSRMGWQVVSPDAGDTSIVSRMFIAPSNEAFCAEYRRRFAHAEARRAQSLVAAARRSRQEGRIGEALAAYEAAITVQPDNWSIVTETAGFALNVLELPRAAMDLARSALEGNPLSAPAWNILGDCAYRQRDLPAAVDAYQRADAVTGGDAKALLNLAYCACMEDHLDEALVWIARALSVDCNGNLTPEILRRQSEIVGRLAAAR